MNANLKTDHAHRVEHDFIELKNYNFAAQQVVLSNHLIEQLRLSKVSNKSMQTFAFLDALTRLSGFGLVMSKGFASIECFKQMHAIQDQLAIKNFKIAIQELKDIEIDVYHYINIDGKKRNKKIKQRVKLFNVIKLENSDHGKGLVYEFNHITTQFIDNRLGKAEYFKLYAKKHSIPSDKYEFYSNVLSENLLKLCSLDYGFTVSEVNHFTSFSPDELATEFEKNTIIHQRFNNVDSNAIFSSSSQYKYFSKVMFGSIQCFECLHTHQLQNYVLSKLATNKDRYTDTTGKKYFVGIVTALELREALGFELPKYDDNYELGLAINKLVLDLNKYSEHTISISKLNKAGNRGVLAEFELSITHKNSDELKVVQEAFKYKNKKGNKVSAEFTLLRNFTFKNLFKVGNDGKVKVLSKSLFVQSVVKADEKTKPNNLFSAINDKYSQAHTNIDEERAIQAQKLKKEKEAQIAKVLPTIELKDVLEYTKSNSSIILTSKHSSKIKEITVAGMGREYTYTTEQNLRPKSMHDFELSLEDLKLFKSQFAGIRSIHKAMNLKLNVKFSDGNTATTCINA